jgi:hypothetical protein
VMNSILSAAAVNATFSDDLADAVYPADAPDFVAVPLDPAETDWTYYDPTPADRQWAAENLNDDDGRDWDSEADAAAAIDAHERGLIFA